MTDLMTSTALHLRQRASQYRSQADETRLHGIAEELCALAADYERDAARLEQRLAKAKQAIRFGMN